MMTVARVSRNRSDYYAPDFFGGVLDSFIHGDVRSGNKKSVAANVVEADDAYEIQFLLAGFSKEDVEIKVEDNVLNVKGEKEQVDSDVKQLRKEFSVKNFERAFTLPDTVNLGGIKATFDNGILSIDLPKREPVKPVSVKIDVT